MDYYNPETNTGPASLEENGVWLCFDLTGCIHKDNMPLSSQEWFSRPAREGYEWKCVNGKWPEEVPLEPIAESEKYQSLIVERDNAISKTDWVIKRHRDQKELGKETTLSESEFMEVLQWRDDLRQLPQLYKTSDEWVWPPTPAVVQQITKD